MEKQFIDEQINLLEFFEKGINIVLSTSYHDVVTSRTITAIPYQNALYFTSIKRSGAKKIEQIEKNPKVAICINTIQIIGEAMITGFVSDSQNEKFMKIYKQKLPDSYERFAKIPSAVVIKIELHSYKDWKMIDGQVVVTNIDFINQVIKKNSI